MSIKVFFLSTRCKKSLLVPSKPQTLRQMFSEFAHPCGRVARLVCDRRRSLEPRFPRRASLRRRSQYHSNIFPRDDTPEGNPDPSAQIAAINPAADVIGPHCSVLDLISILPGRIRLSSFLPTFRPRLILNNHQSPPTPPRWGSGQKRQRIGRLFCWNLPIRNMSNFDYTIRLRRASMPRKCCRKSRPGN